MNLKKGEGEAYSKVSAGNSGQQLIPDTYIVLSNGRIPGSIIWYANAVSYSLSTNQN